MSLIPADAGIRMRMQTDEMLRPLVPVTEIPADLTELIPGRKFSARIQEVLPENTYKALVAGRSLTLALPEGAKAGDTLELVVVSQTPRAIVAKLAPSNTPPAENGGDLFQYTTLSRTAQLIGGLLPREGETPAPATLNRGQPLLTRPPTSAADILTQLPKAVSQSGMFYEAHQVQWVLGERPLADLLAEPQAAHSAPETLAAIRQDPNTKLVSAILNSPPLPEAGSSLPPPSTAMPAQDPNTKTAPTMLNPRPLPEAGSSLTPLSTTVPAQSSILQSLFGTDEARPSVAAYSANAANAAVTSNNPSSAVPEDLRPLVQQQLEAAATQRMVWHGEVWPDQKLEWNIEREAGRGDDPDANALSWNTTLRLTTPRLGEIDASLHLSEEGLRIVIATPHDATASDLRSAIPVLQDALTASGVKLISLQVKHDQAS